MTPSASAPAGVQSGNSKCTIFQIHITSLSRARTAFPVHLFPLLRSIYVTFLPQLPLAADHHS